MGTDGYPTSVGICTVCACEVRSVRWTSRSESLIYLILARLGWPVG